MTDCENSDFAQRGTSNCRFFGPKNGPQNDSATESFSGTVMSRRVLKAALKMTPRLVEGGGELTNHPWTTGPC